MAVMEINLPSGFTVDRDSLYALRRYKGVKRVDPEMGDTKVRFFQPRMSWVLSIAMQCWGTAFHSSLILSLIFNSLILFWHIGNFYCIKLLVQSYLVVSSDILGI